ncbi:hypothetical protein Y1Q_0021507 [Alligator mississippiensis]|uniref:Uncharacterized protein n=1 Tax=Alligator mississippiensis TaxID=8496 RepID=A0A151PAV0_ALLMI|nr:hypothetical protein Y1Q_0021507 [Alligator mississippiensis]
MVSWTNEVLTQEHVTTGTPCPLLVFPQVSFIQPSSAATQDPAQEASHRGNPSVGKAGGEGLGIPLPGC